MNPFPDFHIPPTEAALLQCFADAAESMKSEEVRELLKKGAELSATITNAGAELEKIEARYAEIKGARDEALRKLRGYYEVDGAGPAGEEPGEENPNYDPAVVADELCGGAAGGSMQDAAQPSEAVIGSASEVSDEQVAEAQRQDAREAKDDDVNPRALETVAG